MSEHLLCEADTVPSPGTKASGLRRPWGLVATGLLGGSLVALYAVAAPFVLPALRRVCLPYVPATPAQVDNVLQVLQARTGSLVDIGSGDGRIVIAAAQRGFRASGFELNPWLVWYSRYRARREGVHRSTSFYISDLWKVSFAQYSNVVIFGVPQMMEQLEEKLSRELGGGARVVACRFPFPSWQPDATAGEGIDTVWVYNASSFSSLSPAEPQPSSSSSFTALSPAEPQPSSSSFTALSPAEPQPSSSSSSFTALSPAEPQAGPSTPPAELPSTADNTTTSKHPQP